jgi:hypothetical protein
MSPVRDFFALKIMFTPGRIEQSGVPGSIGRMLSFSPYLRAFASLLSDALHSIWQSRLQAGRYLPQVLNSRLGADHFDFIDVDPYLIAQLGKT